MSGTAEPDVRVFADPLAVSAAAAAWVAAKLGDAVRARGRASFVVSGGSTPRILYQLLGTQFKELVPWPAVHVFWGDERYVPHDDSRSNYRLVKETLLDRITLPIGQVHVMPTHLAEPSAAARDYESTLTRFFSGGPPVFDVVLLGIGEDGHTASVFPGSPAMTSTQAVMAVTAPAEPSTRLTLTLPVIAGARRIGVLVVGQGKARALAATVAGDADTPAAALARTAQSAIWWVDHDAAGMLRQGVPRER